MHQGFRSRGFRGSSTVLLTGVLSACVLPKYNDLGPAGGSGEPAGGQSSALGGRGGNTGGSGSGSTASLGGSSAGRSNAGGNTNLGGFVSAGSNPGGGAANGDNAHNGGASLGGAPSAGGTPIGGGAPNGGVPAGGNATAGGVGGRASGGVVNGGTTTAGGKSSGGAAPLGGATNGGSPGSGGAAPLGGATNGGSPGSGGAANGGTAMGGAGVCSRATVDCSATAPTLTLKDIALGINVTSYGTESDTSPLPMAIAPIPSGGSRLAWLGTDSKVYVAKLTCDDQLVPGSIFSLPAVDFQDIHADDSGGAVLLTRNATNDGTDNCGTGTLCGGTSSQCQAMWLVRFANDGSVVWEKQVTNLSDELAGYDSGARFIWWYQHHGRLAYSGSNYAAVFGVAITVANGTCVDVHEGDRLQIVSSSGALVTTGSLPVGMSHAWTSRVLWDPRASAFVATDATDNNCRIANPLGGLTIAAGTCDGTLFNGDIVLASHGGYWNAWSQGGEIRLEHFTTGSSDKRVTAGSSQHPHLVSLGASKMLITWQSGSSVAAQVRSAGANAETIGAQFGIGVADHDYGAWKAYPDGTAAYAASGANATSIRVARVGPCL